MSSSSTQIYSSPNSQKSKAAVPISDIFFDLGVVSSRGNKYEWMKEFPDALPLLEAISNSFTKSSVLSESEADNYHRFIAEKPALQAPFLYQASDAIENAPELSNIQTLRVHRLKSAQSRLQLLKKQKLLLRELVDKKKTRRNTCSHPRKPQRAVEINELCTQYRSKIEILRRLERREAASIMLDSDLMRYCGAEQLFVERIADFASGVFLRYTKAIQESSDSFSIRLLSVVGSYGKLCAQQAKYEAHLARDTAFLTSLSINDGSYLEMTNSSMSNLLEELRFRTVSALKGKMADVCDNACKDLSSEVHAFTLSESLRKQEDYIETMQLCVQMYMKQRLRIHCFRLLAEFISEKRDSMFKYICELSSYIREQEAISENGSSSGSGEGITSVYKVVKGSKRTDSFYTYTTLVEAGVQADMIESSVFSSALHDARSVMTELKQRVGIKGDGLDLEYPPLFTEMVPDLEKVLSSNQSVLDFLLHRSENLREGAGGVAQSSNKFWAKRVNGKRRAL